jgi:hypothetical protein
MYLVWWCDEGKWHYWSFGDDFDGAWDYFSTFIGTDAVAILDKDSKPVLYTERAKEVEHESAVGGE